MIERQICIGLIVSTEYLQQILSIWEERYIKINYTRYVASWCFEYYAKYNRAPNENFQSIYFVKLESGKYTKSEMEELEEDIFPSLSEEYKREKYNVDYLLDQTQKYFQRRRIEILNDEIQDSIDRDEITSAELLISNYKTIPIDRGADLDLSSEDVLDHIEKAYSVTTKSVVKYTRALGEMWNHQLVRGGFIALMGTDKRGKSFWLLDIAIRAARQDAHVAFFQAGDMTEAQQLIRTSVYLAQRSNLAKYTGEMYEPVRDCAYNQINQCDRTERTCDTGVFTEHTVDYLRHPQHAPKLNELITEYEDNEDYTPCIMCDDCKGVAWIKKIDVGSPLLVDEAKDVIHKFFIKNQRKFKLSTYANSTLSIHDIETQLELWERQDGFIADLVVVDYADLLIADHYTEHRHKIDDIWKGLRRISQARHALVVTATHADADGYKRDQLSIGNFSEDRRKNAHVTAMYGLNQDKSGREKLIGIMRINEIVVREGAFSSANAVHVLQNLRRGLPCLTSYW